MHGTFSPGDRVAVDNGTEVYEVITAEKTGGGSEYPLTPDIRWVAESRLKALPRQ
jgi:hypothetical protein